MTTDQDPHREQYAWIEVEGDKMQRLYAITQAAARTQEKKAEQPLPQIDDLAQRVEIEWLDPLKQMRVMLDTSADEDLQLMAAIENARQALEADGRMDEQRRVLSLRDQIESQLNRQGVDIDTRTALETGSLDL